MTNSLTNTAGDLVTPDALTFTYTNWRGETDVRFVDVAGAYFHFGSTEWHGEPQWLFRAHDRVKAAFRDFAVKDIVFAASPAHATGAAMRERLRGMLVMAVASDDDFNRLSPAGFRLLNEIDATIYSSAIEREATPISSKTAMRAALEKIAGAHHERVGHCVTDMDEGPDCSAREAMDLARAALDGVHAMEREVIQQWTRRDLAEGLAALNGEGLSDEYLEQADHLMAHLSYCAPDVPRKELTAHDLASIDAFLAMTDEPDFAEGPSPSVKQEKTSRDTPPEGYTVEYGRYRCWHAYHRNRAVSRWSYEADAIKACWDHAALSSPAPEGKAAQTPTGVADAMLADIAAIIEPKGDAEGTFSGSILEAVMAVQNERDELRIRAEGEAAQATRDQLREEIWQEVIAEMGGEFRRSALALVQHELGKTEGETAQGVEPDAYDAGLLSDYGGGDVDWWWRYIRAELSRAHDFYAEQFAALATPSVKQEEAGRS